MKTTLRPPRPHRSPPRDKLSQPAAHDNTTAERHRAARTVASQSSDATECGMLLDMLGLTPEEGQA